jgi:guanylate kinase
MPSPSNKIVIIAAPSGAGKTSVTRHLLQSLPDQLSFSISCATRAPRNNEKDKVDYYFISVDAFKERINRKEFVEWEMVYAGKYYGTLKSELYRIWQENKTPLLDVDVKGGLNVQQLYPERSLSLFIEPPSIEELERRLNARGTETPESLKARRKLPMNLLKNRSIMSSNDSSNACRKQKRCKAFSPPLKFPRRFTIRPAHRFHKTTLAD